ncbi:MULTISPECIES: energy transducer TonB [unclassified Ensifer]|uniref:energy transducer TonB n=1 Tax=unclassified Ensifer TaxID=2633371 RepID=UPI000813C321|nr:MULTISPECIES: energy transducer TonB [unclassified Ensifer]OCP02353.1 energy transducer TonB [Ensifer sp. LC14]OCP14162.1 energy transducer TonB [Ensifer sp. LC13]OCP14839.1 energy transducer TonB [Ensifer sp. LC11]OCP34325.1 energy transducer TonB [Ensifer sp. LC499]
MKRIVIWAGAAVFSLATHGVVLATLFGSNPQEAQLDLIEGGENVEVALLGDAFEETLQAGAPSNVVEPTEDVPEEVQPAEIEPVEDVAPTQEIAAEETQDLTATEADVILPAEEMPTLQVAEAVVTASVAPVETVVPEVKPEEPKKEKVEKPEPKKEPVKKKKVTRKKAGDQGEQAQNQVKGKLDGEEKGNSANATGKSQSSQVGNANMSNYDGKVRAKINRRYKIPSEARRQGISGTTTVSFTVTADGAVSRVRVAGSSGHPVLDSAALEAVQRAAPFPPFPNGSGMNSKSYALPVVASVR